MKSSANSGERKSVYHSQLRDLQKVQTRELIIRAAGEVISTEGKYDFTVQQIADRAGLSLQCVYKHFPSREALVQGMCAWLYEKNRGAISAGMASLGNDVTEAVRTLVRVSDEEPAVTIAAVVVSLNLNMRPEARKIVDNACRQGLLGSMSNLSSDEAQRAFAVIRYLLSSEAWLVLKQQMGMSSEEAINALSWGLQTLVDDLKKRNMQNGNGPAHKVEPKSKRLAANGSFPEMGELARQ